MKNTLLSSNKAVSTNNLFSVRKSTTPAEADYFNIAGALYDSTTAGKDGSFVFNFTGNFVWIRAVLVYTDGTVSSVMLNN